MKRKSLLSAIGLAAASLALTSCGTLWTSASIDTGTPGYYDLGIYNNYYPAPPASPWITPVYWGSQLYPTPPVPPAVRPTRPGAPTFYPGNNRPSGTSRPSASTPATQPDAIPVPDHPINVSGGQPGIAMPPAGSGLRPAAGRH